MESLASLYKNHIATLQERTRDALARFKLDALLIPPASCSMFFSTIIPIRLK